MKKLAKAEGRAARAPVLRIVRSRRPHGWTGDRRERMLREAQLMRDLTMAALASLPWSVAAEVLNDHWEHITARYPSDWVEVAQEAGVL